MKTNYTTPAVSPFVASQFSKNATTENGMLTNSTSLDACVDLFGMAGAMRGQDTERFLALVKNSWLQNQLATLRILFWLRDIRGGAGERSLFRVATKFLAKEPAMQKNLYLVSEYGRWDDLVALIGSPLETTALQLIAKGLEEKNGLCAKWMPRKGAEANTIRKFLKLAPAVYRHLIVGLSKTVEQEMSAKQWDAINFAHVPSLAHVRYRKAFYRNAPDAFESYVNDLVEGKTKINAGAIYPYDVTMSIQRGEDVRLATAQWNALPNYLTPGRRILPVCDVSGSMSTYPISGNVYPMDVSLSLGLYISERNEGPFKDFVVTFTDVPTCYRLMGTLSERLKQLRSHVGYDTDIVGCFRAILTQARINSVTAEDMPTDILLLSDMEFDSSDIAGKSVTAIEAIREEYSQAGYDLPNIIFWNIQSRHNNVPVRFDESGTALVSGLSPSILKGVLAVDMDAAGKVAPQLTPVEVMLNVINSERYACVTV